MPRREWETEVQVRHLRCRLSINKPFAPQVREVVDRIGLTENQWLHESLIVVLPSIAPAAALVLTEIIARARYYPTVVRLKKEDVSKDPPVYIIAEVIPLQHFYDQSQLEGRG